MKGDMPLGDWTHEAIARECRSSYRSFVNGLRARHIAYFAKRRGAANRTHAYLARDFESALPEGWGRRLAKLLPEDARHRHHLSAASSQTLALGLLGPAALHSRETLDWLFEPVGFMPPLGQRVLWQFEYSVGFGLLHERPRTTDIDLLVSGEAGVACLEAKFTETSMGHRSCAGRTVGACDQRVLSRPYWAVARRVFELQGPTPGKPCQLDLAYQAVRNVAAAIELSGLRQVAAVGLLYDARNPYFAGADRWPGWASVLQRLARDPGAVALKAFSWQELIPGHGP
jgi:Restriction Endonuclease associating with ARP